MHQVPMVIHKLPPCLVSSNRFLQIRHLLAKLCTCDGHKVVGHLVQVHLLEVSLDQPLAWCFKAELMPSLLCDDVAKTVKNFLAYVVHTLSLALSRPWTSSLIFFSGLSPMAPRCISRFFGYVEVMVYGFVDVSPNATALLGADASEAGANTCREVVRTEELLPVKGCSNCRECWAFVCHQDFLLGRVTQSQACVCQVLDYGIGFPCRRDNDGTGNALPEATNHH